MNFSSIVHLEAIGVHIVGSCGHSWPHYNIYHTYCKQLINILHLRQFKGHVRYIIAICQPIAKLHMS